MKEILTTKTLEAYGYECVNWDLPHIQTFVCRYFHRRYSPSGLCRLLARIGFASIRPRLSGAKGVPQIQQQWLQKIHTLRQQASPSEIFLASDEAIIEEQATITRT